MKNQQIKQKLLNFFEDYKREYGKFGSLEVVYDYIGFLKSEKYTKELLKDTWKYCEEQKDIMAKTIFDLNINRSVLDPQNIPEYPFLKNEQLAFKKKAEDNDKTLNVYELLNVFLVNLFIIYDLMDSIKSNKLKGALKDIEGLEIPKLIENAKRESMSFEEVKVLPDKKFLIDNAKMLGASIEVVNKYIIDQIDSEEFLANGKTDSKLSFNKAKSVLNIYGQEIKIQRKSDKPHDHFILEYLFEQENIFDEADFSDIAKTKLGIKEYNGAKDWHTLRHACDRLNKKVEKSTKAQEKEFLIYHSGKTGWCKINPKYL